MSEYTDERNTHVQVLRGEIENRRHKYHDPVRDALQAKLDAVMLEYCPDEMTPEQRAVWAASQSDRSGEVES